MLYFLIRKAVDMVRTKIGALNGHPASTQAAVSRDNCGESIKALERDEVHQMATLLNAKKLLELSDMRRLQEMDAVAYQMDKAPRCILFISHRWISPNHPDPKGEQLKSLQFLLKAIEQLASVYSLPVNDRIKKVKTLKVHGYLQASRVLSKMASENETINSSILSRIGIWVDFMCLPQKNAFGIDDRTAAELALFKQGLRALPSLVASCDYIISLRREDDDYFQRAWCISELCFASFKNHKNVVVLREDLLGQPIDESLLRTKQHAEYAEFEGLETFRGMLDCWQREEKWDGKMALHYWYADLEVVEEDMIHSHEAAVKENRDAAKKWPAPFFTTVRVPRIFPGEADFLMTIRKFLTMAPPRNVALLIIITMIKCGMFCRDIDDYSRCGIHILRARLSGHPGWKTFFDDCLFRLGNTEPLVLQTVAEIEIKYGFDCGAVTYEWETDERLLSLHARATDIWKKQHRRADEEKMMPLLEAWLRQLLLLEHAYENVPSLGLISLSELVENALDAAAIDCEGKKVETGLAFLYAKHQSIYGINLPSAEKTGQFLLDALERFQDEPTLQISNYRHFGCSFVYELSDWPLFDLVGSLKAESVKVDLWAAAHQAEVITVYP